MMLNKNKLINYMLFFIINWVYVTHVSIRLHLYVYYMNKQD